jgi:hypothetical protein
MANPDVIIATTPESIRLDCLRLANRHDIDPKVVVDRAKEFETYVVGAAPSRPATAPRKPTRDNPLA